MPEKDQPQDIVPIEDLNQFAGLLSNWHAKKVAVLEHMMSVPEGTTMSIDGGAEVALQGDMMTGFRAGLNLALMELGSLPFIAEVTAQPVAESLEAPAEEAAPAA